LISLSEYSKNRGVNGLYEGGYEVKDLLIQRIWGSDNLFRAGREERCGARNLLIGRDLVFSSFSYLCLFESLCRWDQRPTKPNKKEESVRRIVIFSALAALMVAPAVVMAEEIVDYGQYDEYEQNGGGRPPCGTWIKKSCGNNYFVRVTNQSYSDGIAVWGESYGGTGIKGTGEVWGGYFEGDGYFSGKVGIGTQSLEEKLNVNGNVKADGYKIIGGTGGMITGVYDSGWREVSINMTYEHVHNLGTNKFLVTVLWSPNSDGSDAEHDNYIWMAGEECGIQLQGITAITFVARTGANGTHLSFEHDGNTIRTGGYARIILLAFG
jgi:hypothetical protein